MSDVTRNRSETTPGRRSELGQWPEALTHIRNFNRFRGHVHIISSADARLA